MSMLEGIRTVRELDLAQQRVLVRVDFDVEPRGGQIDDDTVIRAALPTLQCVLEAPGARLIVASHLGTPAAGVTEGYSLEAAGAALSVLTGCDVHLPDDCVGDAPRKVIQDLRPGQICLLENLRYHPEDIGNDDTFARKLAELCDIYVGDAFSVLSETHASTFALPRMIRERGCGLSVEKELQVYGSLTGGAAKPYVAVIGGASLGAKARLIEALLPRLDVLCLGGGVANTFLAARGTPLGATRIEPERLAQARTLLDKARALRVKVALPTDLVVAPAIDAPESSHKVERVGGSIPMGDKAMALDVGPATAQAFASHIARARTVLWNGPIGLYQKPAFAQGSFAVARAMADSTAFTAVVGTDTVLAVRKAGADIMGRIRHVSTGGGASLALLEGRKLPGLEALRAPVSTPRTGGT